MALPSKGSQHHALSGSIPAFQKGSRTVLVIEPVDSTGLGVIRPLCCEGLPARPVQKGLAASDTCKGQTRQGNEPREPGTNAGGW